jgi:hypothetical protein
MEGTVPMRVEQGTTYGNQLRARGLAEPAGSVG